jgi:hypothetical protein
MKHTYCVIRKVPYRIPGTDRIVWANVLSESNGLALLLVPRSQTDGAHSLVFAEENAIERVFESSKSPTFDVGSAAVKEIGVILKVLGSKFIRDEMVRAFEKDFGDL